MEFIFRAYKKREFQNELAALRQEKELNIAGLVAEYEYLTDNEYIVVHIPDVWIERLNSGQLSRLTDIK